MPKVKSGEKKAASAESLNSQLTTLNFHSQLLRHRFELSNTR